MRPSTLHLWSFARWLLALTLLFGTVLPAPSRSKFPHETETLEARALRTVGPRECAECHVDEHAVWQASSHFTGGRTLSRSAAAKEIAGALGIRRIKGEERCTSCHFTLQTRDSGGLRATHGVSCESCHGPAQEWITAHADFGPGASQAAEEDPAHRLQRNLDTKKLGMIAPGSLYQIGAQCYGCHSISDPELTITAGHPAGDGFELVAWSQGEVRHNFNHDAAGDNHESSQDRRARMYLIGRGLELEYSLRALESANATSLAAMRLRVATAWADVIAITERIQAPSVSTMIKRLETLDLESGSLPADLVDEIAGLTQKLEDELDEVDLSPLFDVLPKQNTYRGSVAR